MRAALYARVSTPASSKRATRDGDRERQDPEVQLLKLRAYARTRGWEVVDEYIDRRSGANPDRPALKRLEADIDAGKVDAVLVVRLDRIMRSTANFVQFLTMLEDDEFGRPRRKPRRDKCGRFIRSGQTPRERPRPDAPPERPSGATIGTGHLAVTKCDECGNELEYTWMHVGRHSYHVGRCARCAPPPTIE